METSGIWGIKLGKVTKQIYNQGNSYPTGLGFQIFYAILCTTDKDLIQRFKQIKLVKEGKKPTKIQQARYAEFANLGVSDCSLEDWYCLLHKAQYNPEYYLTGRDGGRPIDHMVHVPSNGGYSEEYVYTIDLDTDSVICVDYSGATVFDIPFAEIRGKRVGELQSYLSEKEGVADDLFD